MHKDYYNHPNKKQWACTGWSTDGDTQSLHYENQVNPELGYWSIKITKKNIESLKNDPRQGLLSNKEMLDIIQQAEGAHKGVITEKKLDGDKKWVSRSISWKDPHGEKGRTNLKNLKKDIDSFQLKESKKVRKRLKPLLDEENIEI